MENKTAVEWLEDNLIGNPFNEQDFTHNVNVFKQAKQMEKEKMIEFAQEVFRNRYNQVTQSLGNIADDLYNETYKK